MATITFINSYVERGLDQTSATGLVARIEQLRRWGGRIVSVEFSRQDRLDLLADQPVPSLESLAASVAEDGVEVRQ